MSLLLASLRQALRALVKAPAFTSAAVITLALGIATSTSMFSAIHTLLLRPLPFPHPEQLVEVSETRIPGQSGRFSATNFFDYRDQATRFQGLAGYESGTAELTGLGLPQSVSAGTVSAGFFEVLGVQPLLGGYFRPDQEIKGNHRVVVLSEALWRRQFAADPGVVGRSLFLGGEAHLILGVAPKGTLLPLDGPQDLYLPLLRGDNRGMHSLHGVGRLKTGVAAGEALAELKAIAAALALRYPDSNGSYTAYVRDLHAEMIGDGHKPLLLLLGAVALLLLIACSNVASLFLVRATGRRHEVAVRASQGAGRAQLLLPFLAEGCWIAFAGAALGLLLAKGLLRLLPAWLPSISGLSPDLVLALDGPVLAVALALTVVTGSVFAMVPGLAALRLDLRSLLSLGGRSGSRRGGAARSVLVIAEVAMAVMLLLAAGLLMHSFFNVLATAPGFQPNHVVSVRLDLPDARYPKEAQIVAFQQELARRLASLPGVESVGQSAMAILGDSTMTTRFHEGRTQESSSRWPGASVDAVDPGFFKTLRVPILAGRGIEAGDVGTGKPVMVVNESFARSAFPGRSPLGAQMVIGFSSEQIQAGSLWEIVGVVGDIRDAGLERVPRPKFYLPLAQMPLTEDCAYLRSPASARALEGPIRAQVAALDPNLAVVKISSLTERVQARLADRTQTLVLLGLFAGLALVLAAIGIYGLLAYSVAQRGRELGIRLALGAQRGQVLALVLGEGLVRVAAGAGLGLAGFAVLGRILAHQLVGVRLFDPWTLMAVPLVLVAVALLACVGPTLRAIRTNPVDALRHD